MLPYISIVLAPVEFPDGVGKAVSGFGDGLFGIDYSAEFDRAGIDTALSTRPDGTRRITVSIPRKYFYLHEYGRLPDQALGNGNSQFGINTNLTFLAPDPEAEIRFPDDRRFILLQPLVSKDDAETLAALELVNPGTGRWSARLF